MADRLCEMKITQAKTSNGNMLPTDFCLCSCCTMFLFIRMWWETRNSKNDVGCLRPRAKCSTRCTRSFSFSLTTEIIWLQPESLKNVKIHIRGLLWQNQAAWKLSRKQMVACFKILNMCKSMDGMANNKYMRWLQLSLNNITWVIFGRWYTFVVSKIIIIIIWTLTKK